MEDNLSGLERRAGPAIILDKGGNVVDANQAACDLLGYALPALKGRDFADLIIPESYPQFALLFDHDRQSLELQGYLVCQDSIHLPVAIQGTRSESGQWRIRICDLRSEFESEESANRRNSILHAVAVSTEQLLKSRQWTDVVQNVMARLGQATQVSRVYIFENFNEEDGGIRASQRFEWAQEGITLQIGREELQNFRYDQEGWDVLSRTVLQGRPVMGITRDLPKMERDLLSFQQVQAIAIFPIPVEQRIWGFIGFDECGYERKWMPAELDALSIAANILGAVIQHRKTETALRASEERYRLIIENQGDGVAIVDPNEKVIFANLEMDKIFGLGPGEITGRNLLDFVVPELAPTLRIQTALRSQGERSQYELDILRADGERRNLLVTATPYFDEDNHFAGAFGVLHDNTSQKQAQKQITALLEAERAYHRQADTLREVTTALAADMKLDQVKERILLGIEKMLPYQSCTLFLYEGDRLVIAANHGFEEPLATGWEVPMDDTYFTMTRESGKAVILSDASQDPHFKWWSASKPARGWMCVPLPWRGDVIGFLTVDGEESGCFTAQDASLAEIFANQAALSIRNSQLFAASQRLAITDPLTDLYNRRFLFELGSREFQRARRYKRPMSIMVIDLDLFKQVNDTYGHSMGDLVLRAATDRIRTCMRVTDIFGRYGGDEFMALLLETDQVEALAIAERLSETLSEKPLKVNNISLTVTASVGIASLHANTASLDELIDQSDLAMYRAKRAGRNAVSV